MGSWSTPSRVLMNRLSTPSLSQVMSASVAATRGSCQTTRSSNRVRCVAWRGACNVSAFLYFRNPCIGIFCFACFNMAQKSSEQYLPNETKW